MSAAGPADRVRPPEFTVLRDEASPAPPAYLPALRNRRMRCRFLLPLLLVTPLSAAESPAIQPVDPQLGRAADFYLDVFPILEAKCLACHNVRTKEGALVLENVDAILKGGDSGPAVVAGKPDESLIVQLAARADEPAMPPLPNSAQAQPLSPRELGVLRQWVQEGAQKGTPPPASAIQWRPVPSHFRAIQALALDPSGRFVAAGRANRVVLFDLSDRREVAELTDPALLSVQYNGAPMYGQGSSHQDLVHAVAFSPDGNLLASAGYREVKLWERVRDQKLQEWDAGVAATGLTVSADGALAATGHADGSIRLWNLAAGQPGAVLAGHAAAVHGLCFNPDGTELYTGSDDKTLRKWSIGEGKELGQLASPAEIKGVLVSRDGGTIVTAHQDNKLRYWSRDAVAAPPAEGDAAASEPPKPLRETGDHSQPVTALVAIPDTDEFLAASRDGNVRMYNLTNGNQVRAFNLGSPVLDAAVTPGGERVSAAGENGVTRIWNRSNGQQLAEVKGDLSLARQVAALTDDVTVTKNKVGLRDTAEKDADKDLKGREESLTKSKEQRETAVKAREEAEKKFQEADAKAKEAETKLAEKTDDDGLKKAKEEADKARTTAQEALTKANGAVESADRAIKLSEEALARSKQILEAAKQAHLDAQAAAKQTEETLNQRKDELGKSNLPHRALASSPWGGQLIVGGDGNRLDLVDGTSGAAYESITAAQPVHFADSTAGGALVSVEGTHVVVRQLRPQWQLVARLGPKADSPLDVSESPLVDRVLTAAFSPDGKLLVTGGGDPSRSGELHLWDVATRQVVRTFADAHSDAVFDAEFSRDGKLLVSGAADKFVKLFETETGKFIRGYEGHTSHVLCVAIKADDSSLASGGADNAVKVWNLETGEQRRTMNNYQKQVTSIDFIGVSDNLVSSGGDKSVRLFTAANGNNFRTLGGMPDYVYAAVASPDQKFVVAAGEDGVVRVWDGQNGNELMKFEPPSIAEQTASN